jgi:membrane-associated protein
MARFVPVVRTFAPIVAGVGKMNYRTFVIYNIVGGVLWGIGITTLGYFLGEVSWIESNIEVALILIVLISVLPMLIEILRHRRANRK